MPAGRKVFARECAACHSTKVAPENVRNDREALARFYEGLADRLKKLYAGGAPARAILEARADIFKGAQDQMAGALAAELETISGRRLAERPLNNASLLAQLVYGTGLERFDRVLVEQGGDVKKATAHIRGLVAGGGDPWALLPGP